MNLMFPNWGVSNQASGDEEEVIEASLISFLVPAKDSSPDMLEQRLDKFIIDYCRQRGLPDYEWDRPISLSGNHRRLVTLNQIEKGNITYVGGGNLTDLSLKKQAGLVVARLKMHTATPLMNPDIYKSEKHLVNLVEEYNDEANDVIRNVLGTCRAILAWYEKYYEPASEKD